MKEPYYNTFEGISKAVTTLEGLNNLVKARHSVLFDYNKHRKEWK